MGCTVQSRVRDPDIFSEYLPSPDYSKYDFPFSNRYRPCKVYADKEKVFFGTYEFFEIPISVNDSYHQIKPGEEGRWDLISYKYYQTVDYWWVITQANNVYDPFDSPEAGTIIRIPSLDFLVTRDIGLL